MKTQIRFKHILASCFLGIAHFLFASTSPFYPTGIAINNGGKYFISEKGTKQVSVYTTDGTKEDLSYKFQEIPTGLAIDNDKMYVTTFETQGLLHVINISDGKEITTINTGSGACYPIINKNAGKLYVCNQFDNSVSEIDLNKNVVTRNVKVLREPKSAVMSLDGKFLFVTNFLPAQRADLDYVSSCVSVIDLKSFTKVKDIRLANGSNALRGICITPDGKYVYVSHNLGRYTVPTSQLQQGWMNTSSFSIIDAEKQEYLGEVLVDEPERGAAGIWGIQCNNEKIFISHSGTHEISVIDQKKMLEKFLSYPDKSALEYDLTFLYGLRQRIPLEGNGPRNFVLTDNSIIVPTYFADVLNVMDINSLKVSSVNLNPDRVESVIDKGEKYFNDASHCFQNWQSCNGCHPGDGRTDGMNWDLMNDGVGNPKIVRVCFLVMSPQDV